LAKHLITKNPEHVNASGGQNMAPLATAIYGNHLQVAELLLMHGADIHVRGEYDNTLLHASIVTKPFDTILWLLSHGTDINGPNCAGYTPLHWAARRGFREVIRVLLVHNADVQAQNSGGEVPLHRAAISCEPSNQNLAELQAGHLIDSIGSIQLLLSHGADVNARDNHGSTPLHHSSRIGEKLMEMGTVEICRSLLEHGASIDAKNNAGETPLDVALADERHEIAEFLLEHGAKKG
jgi:ankyrin repeat protein